MDDKSIHVKGPLTIKNSQVGALSGDVSYLVQTTQQSSSEGTGELWRSLDNLTECIQGIKELTELQKLAARQQVEMIAMAANAAREEPSRTAVGTAMEKLTSLLGKVPDAAKLVEVAAKAWEVVAKGVGA